MALQVITPTTHPKILLVDDREDNLLSIESILTPDGYQVSKANSGREALKILLDETDFALILMDVKMPILNGFETATLIHEREKLKNIPIIFITANNYGDENIYKGYQSGGIDYILKPINPDVLRTKVSVFINLYEKNRLLIKQELKLRAMNETLGLEVQDRKASEELIKKLNTELHQQVARLESENGDMKRFLLTCAQDLATPLMEIVAINEKLREDTNRTPALDSIAKQRLQESTDRAQRVLLEMIAFYKESIGQKPAGDDLNKLLEQFMNGLEKK